MKFNEYFAVLLLGVILCIHMIVPEPVQQALGEIFGSKTRNELRAARLEMFNDFIKTYNRVYATEEEFKRRFQIFRENLEKAEYLQKSERGTARYGVTSFSDLSKHNLGLKIPDFVPEFPPAEIPDIELPDHWDWREKNAVTAVKDQGGCGCCWAFSAVGNIEGQWAIKSQKLVSLSEQELVDCDLVNNGCSGGLMITAYKEIMDIGGLETDKRYPYLGEEGLCKLNKSAIVVKISGAVTISSNEDEMAKWIVKNGPVSAVINSEAMDFYKEGVSHPSKEACDPQAFNHGILIVGFGVEKSNTMAEPLPYWIIKNSQGPLYGEKGYYKLFRGDGSCGINKMVSSALIN